MVEKEHKENPTPVPEQIKLTDYPQAFYATKPEAKSTGFIRLYEL